MLELIIIEISVYILLLPIALGTIFYKRLIKTQRILFWMISLIALNQFLSEGWKIWILPENNLPFLYVYVLIEFVFLALIYERLLHPFIASKIIRLGLGLFIIYWLITFFWPGKMWTYPDYIRPTESILIFILAGAYFYKVFVESKLMRLGKDFSFWLSAGLIIYFSSNSLLFLYGDLVADQQDPVFNAIWTIHAILTILLYITYSIALTCKMKPN
jgi:hypothetical protein